MDQPVESFATRAMQYIPRLRRYARALTGDISAADDLVQDALERALLKQSLWREGTDLRAWLFTVMHNIFINQVRSAAANRLVPMDDVAADAFADTPPLQASDRLEIRDLDVAGQAQDGCELAVVVAGRRHRRPRSATSPPAIAAIPSRDGARAALKTRSR